MAIHLCRPFCLQFHGPTVWRNMIGGISPHNLLQAPIGQSALPQHFSVEMLYGIGSGWTLTKFRNIVIGFAFL